MEEKQLLNKELFKSVPSFLIDYFDKYEYPWLILPHIHEIILELIKKGIEGYSLDKERLILKGKNVTIDEKASIKGPLIIGDNVEIRPNAYIRGNVIICSNSVIGNSSEIKNSILLEHVEVPHFNYVGDSILGAYAHLGAGVICSNLRNDKKEVIIHSSKDINTNLIKCGSFIGEHTDIGCNSVLNPGTVVCSYSASYPLTMLRGVYPSFSLIKSSKEVVSDYKK